MFISNKYKKWYDNIINNAVVRASLTGYTETHHIIPRSLGGPNEANNLVVLTAKEHFICHLLLPKFTNGKAKQKMWFAAHFMAKMSREYQDRYRPSARIYEILKIKYSEAISARSAGKTYEELHGIEKATAMKLKKSLPRGKQSPETIEKRRIACIGKKRSDEQKTRMSLAQKGKLPKVKTDEEKAQISQKISNALTGRIITAEHRAKLSAALVGKKVGQRSEETKEKMRKPKSAEHKANMRKPKSAEHIAAIIAAKAAKKIKTGMPFF